MTSQTGALLPLPSDTPYGSLALKSVKSSVRLGTLDVLPSGMTKIE